MKSPSTIIKEQVAVLMAAVGFPVETSNARASKYKQLEGNIQVWQVENLLLDKRGDSEMVYALVVVKPDRVGAGIKRYHVVDWYTGNIYVPDNRPIMV